MEGQKHKFTRPLVALPSCLPPIIAPRISGLKGANDTTTALFNHDAVTNRAGPIWTSSPPRFNCKLESFKTQTYLNNWLPPTRVAKESSLCLNATTLGQPPSSSRADAFAPASAIDSTSHRTMTSSPTARPASAPCAARTSRASFSTPTPLTPHVFAGQLARQLLKPIARLTSRAGRSAGSAAR